MEISGRVRAQVLAHACMHTCLFTRRYRSSLESLAQIVTQLITTRWLTRYSAAWHCVEQMDTVCVMSLASTATSLILAQNNQFSHYVYQFTDMEPPKSSSYTSYCIFTLWERMIYNVHV